MSGESEYSYEDGAATHSGSYLHRHVLDVLAGLRSGGAKRVLDLGCGNGYFAKEMARIGFEVVAIDSSTSGIELAQREASPVRFEVASVYDDIVRNYGRFDAVVSTEVVEHLYDPRTFVRNAFTALEEGGTLVLSTPYHGYLKNLALAITGKMDGHFTALWDHGHIKFFSRSTMTQLLEEAGFESVKIRGLGRIPPLAKTMLVTARKPAA
jgi:ubiquinone biosynthesis O-methyltransferase